MSTGQVGSLRYFSVHAEIINGAKHLVVVGPNACVSAVQCRVGFEASEAPRHGMAQGWGRTFVDCDLRAAVLPSTRGRWRAEG